MKKILSIILICAMLMSMVACGTSSNDNTDSTGNAESGTQASDGASETDLEPVELTMALFILGELPADWDMVTAEMNKIIQEEINATVNFVPISISSYMDQIRLMLTSGEDLDLFITGMTGNMTLKQHIADKQVIPLNDLVDQYGQGIKEALGDFIDIGSVDGQYYAVATYRDFANEIAYVIRTDLVEKYNIDVDSIKSLEDLEPVLATIAENEPDMVPFHPGQNAYYGIAEGIEGDFWADGLSSKEFFDGVLMDMTDENMEVVNYYETDRYAELAGLMREWYQAGYISKDATTLTDDCTARCKAGQLASFIYGYKPGVEVQLENSTGVDLTVISFGDTRSCTTNVTGLMHAVAANSKEPERAVMLLNLLYTNADLINLFNYGIEGVHYEEKEDGHIGYPEGVDSSNVGYNMSSIGFAFGNQALCKVWEGDPLNLWEQMKEFNNSAKKSVALGFVFDITPVENEYIACQNVADQYVRAIGTGSVDPETMIPELVSALKAAGVDKVVAEKQRQLDEWAAAQ